jgi:hypothetical protein
MFNRQLALMIFAAGFIGPCVAQEAAEEVVIAPPVPEEKKLDALTGKWQGAFRGEEQGGTWEGKWILDGHLLTLGATNLAPGKVQKEVDVFGYSARAKRHYMIAITAGGQIADKAEIFWFTIDGNVWHFAPTETKVGGKAVHRRVSWRVNSPGHMTILLESSEDGVHWTSSGQRERRWIPADGKAAAAASPAPKQSVTGAADPQEQGPVPPPGPEMARLSTWVGTWPNKHQEKGFLVDGSMDSKLLGDGYFLGFFETNKLVYDSGKKRSQKEVDVWGYSDTARLYFRIDSVTYNDGARTPEIDLSYWWFGKGDAVILGAPIPETKIGDKTVRVRYGFVMEQPNVLTVFEQDLTDGVHWSERKVMLKRTRTSRVP